MKPRPLWVRVSADLSMSQCGRYALFQIQGSWHTIWYDGAGWSQLFRSPADSLLAAKMRVNRHRFTRPLEYTS